MSEAASKTPDLLSDADRRKFRELEARDLQTLKEIFDANGVEVDGDLLVSQFHRIRANQGIDWAQIEKMIGENEKIKSDLFRISASYQIYRANQDTHDLVDEFNSRVISNSG